MSGGDNIDYWFLRENRLNAKTALRMLAIAYKVEEQLEETEDERIWKEECGGRCAILHVERCLRYEEGKCNFPDSRKAKETILKLEEGH